MSTNIKIYLVDDDEEDRYLMLHAFKQIGVTQSLYEFDNGEHLINHLSSLEPHELPHLIILDYNMPRLNGVEALSQIKENNTLSSIKVVIYTTSVNEQTKTHCLKLGALDCFIKPTNFNCQLEIAKTFLQLAAVSDSR